MSITKHYFLLFIFTFVTGCSVYQINPELEQTVELQPIVIDSYSIKVSDKTKVWTMDSFLSKTEDVLSSSARLDVAPIGGVHHNEPYFHMDIDVKYSHGGAGGDAFITALSLGLIPTKGENRDLFEYRFNLYKNGELFRTNSYSINEEYYSHIILLPFALVDNLFFNHPVSFYEEALKENLQV